MSNIFFSSLASLALVILFSPLCLAVQVSQGNREADLNGDGQVSETELKLFNRDERGS